MLGFGKLASFWKNRYREANASQEREWLEPYIASGFRKIEGAVRQAWRRPRGGEDAPGKPQKLEISPVNARRALVEIVAQTGLIVWLSWIALSGMDTGTERWIYLLYASVLIPICAIIIFNRMLLLIEYFQDR